MVFEVIVRQGMAGAPWQEICRGPMEVNKITDDEVSDEIARRLFAHCRKLHGPCNCCLCVERKEGRLEKRIAAELDRRQGRSCDGRCRCECAHCYEERAAWYLNRQF